jgi:hypothetical protein
MNLTKFIKQNFKAFSNKHTFNPNIYNLEDISTKKSLKISPTLTNISNLVEEHLGTITERAKT